MRTPFVALEGGKGAQDASAAIQTIDVDGWDPTDAITRNGGRMRVLAFKI